MKPLGVYIHIPFCQQKCPYCDFYSLSDSSSEIMDQYETKVGYLIDKMGVKTNHFVVNSVYFGGGTPSFFGAKRLGQVLKSIQKSFNLSDDAEITTELNPNSTSKDDLISLKEVGFNRVSFGIQSANPKELTALGRLHTVADAKQAVLNAQEAGFDNISVDLMLGIPHQTVDSLRQTLDFVCSLGVTHVSAYILKLEEGTPFANRIPPDEDLCCDLYLEACEVLEQCGFLQYEISNFAKAGFASRHNLKYWNCDDYIGIGPAAHSLLEGKRFFYPRDIGQFLEDPATIPDGEGGDIAEYVMMRLRLTEGISNQAVMQRYGITTDALFGGRQQKYLDAGLMAAKGDQLFLTKRGFLLSNGIIGDLIC